MRLPSVMFFVLLIKNVTTQPYTVFTDEINSDALSICRKHGYEAKYHSVTTADGYILSALHVTPGKPQKIANSGPFLLIHPGGESYVSYLANFQHSLAFVLVDEGFDVWMMDLRGGDPAQGHVKWSFNDKQYWNFTCDEQAEYDVPAGIDFVLKQTSYEKLYLLGFSSGGTVLFMTLSKKTEYNEKVQLFLQIGASSRIHGGLGLLLQFPYKAVESALTYQRFPPLMLDNFVRTLAKIVAVRYPDILTHFLVPMIVSSFDPYNYMTHEVLKMLVSFYPTTVGTGHMSHMVQLSQANNRLFAFDYGPEGNLLKYGKETPPEYSVSKITAKTAFFWSQNDQTISEYDILTLASEMPNVVFLYRIPFDLFTHDEIIFGKFAKELLYYKVAKAAKLYPIKR